MTATAFVKPGPASRLVNGLLSIKPLANFARSRARKMMIERAESMGIPWRKTAAELQSRDWSAELAQVSNPNLTYPAYYLNPFHAYPDGNLGWEPASEVEVAAYSVHSTIFGEKTPEGDAKLRAAYHDVLKATVAIEPREIVDLGCSVGMSTFALQRVYPQAQLTGVDLSPNFLAVAAYNTHHSPMNPDRAQPRWVHAAAENTGLPAASYDLVSACLLYHELPQTAAIAILQEARRLLKPGGYLGIMDMNPKSQIYAQMPPYILTLLKSTEPFLDQYFALDLGEAIEQAGFELVTIQETTVRHRALVARAH
ncbi:MAG: class I SAM-dependent methyltransferase [Limnothrix sp. CACIAM 69d]|nr:MAG: class I SAM-dependent methyltransferase [Limnothrix sp. CACIAM 69d]